MFKFISLFFLLVPGATPVEHHFELEKDYSKVLLVLASNQERFLAAAGIQNDHKSDYQLTFEDYKFKITSHKQVNLNPGDLDVSLTETIRLGLDNIEIEMYCAKPPPQIKTYRSIFIFKSKGQKTTVECKVWIEVNKRPKLIKFMTHSSLVRFEKELRKALHGVH